MEKCLFSYEIRSQSRRLKTLTTRELDQSELNKFKGIGVVTVSSYSAIPDKKGQCQWTITFETLAGHVPPIRVAKPNIMDFNTSVLLMSGDRVEVVDDFIRGTSLKLSGSFSLEWDGVRTGYIPFDASAAQLKWALSSSTNIGKISAHRSGPDINDGYEWYVTFIASQRPLPLIVADGLDLEGTMASVTISNYIEGSSPPFNGPDNQYKVTSDLYVVATGLKQGIRYFFRVSASSAISVGPTIETWPPSAYLYLVLRECHQT